MASENTLAAPSQSPIDQQLNRQDTALELLTLNFQRLAERLAPLTNKVPISETETAGKDMHYESRIATHVAENAQNIENVNLGLDVLMDKLEI